MKTSRLNILTLITVIALAGAARAQFVTITDIGVPVVASFDNNLPGSAVTNPWVDGETFTGWYAHMALTDAAPASYRATNGTSSGIVLYQQRQGADGIDGALSLGPRSTVSGDLSVGWRLVNGTDQAITDFTVSYVGEQWTANSTPERSLEFAYQVGATGLTGGTWTSVSALDFAALRFSEGSPVTLNGSLPENSTAIGAVTISGVNWQPGQELWLRWTHEGSVSVSHTLGIDDVTVTAIPEPATYALASGLLALGAVFLRRRMRP